MRTRSTTKRNTRSSRPQRNTPLQGQRASAQLDAFPASDNARARQSTFRKAVVSIRLGGTVINQLDEEAKRATKDGDYRGGGWYSWRKVSRTDVIERAIKAWLDGAAQKGKSK